MYQISNITQEQTDVKQIVLKLLDTAINGPQSLVSALCQLAAENCFDKKNYESQVKIFLQSIRNEEIEEQMELLSRKIRGSVIEASKENNLFVFESIYQILDHAMKEMEIPNDRRETLKEGMIAGIFAFIFDKDKKYYNLLRLKMILENRIDEQKRDLNEMRRQYDHLYQMMLILLESYENTSDTYSLLRIPLKSLNLDRPDIMDKRMDKQERIQTLFNDGSNVVFLTGRPGMGKTTLARLYAGRHNYEEIYFEKYNQSFEKTVEKLLSEDGKSLGHNGNDVLEYWNHLKFEDRRKILLIIDNFNGDILQNGNKQRYTKELSGEFYKKLKEIGIRVIVTTRISVSSESCIVVNEVDDPMKLFMEHYGGILSNNQKKLVEEIIESVKKNTMLIVQLAYIWKKQDKNGKLRLAEQLKENSMFWGEEALYMQTRNMLDFSGIRDEKSFSETFACAALLPLRGEDRERFIEISECDVNSLNDLIEGSWILSLPGEKIALHPLIKEIALREGMVPYTKCTKFCRSIRLALNVEIPLEDRYPYADCAWEIYKTFSSMPDLDDVLIGIFYLLGDIYDNQNERERSRKLVDTVLNHLGKVEIEQVVKAEMLSGIAYSINNCFTDMKELDSAETMLKEAHKMINGLPDECKIDNRAKKVRAMIWSDWGSNFLGKRKWAVQMADKCVESALEKHKKALQLREIYLQEAETEKEMKEANSKLATSYTTVATDYFYLSKYEQAVEFHLAAHKIRKDLGLNVTACVNEERIIGCLLSMYKNNLMADEKLWKICLSYYPALIEINDTYSRKSLQTSINYFDEIYQIIHNDRRLEKFICECEQKKQKIENRRRG